MRKTSWNWTMEKTSMPPPTSSYLRTMRRTTFFQLTFLQLAQSRAKQYGTSVASQDEDATSTPSYSSSTSNMLDVCKHAAAQLDVLWPVAVAETTRSQYKRKRLPQVNSATKQPLPLFPERPYSSRGARPSTPK